MKELTEKEKERYHLQTTLFIFGLVIFSIALHFTPYMDNFIFYSIFCLLSIIILFLAIIVNK
jgi:uncharacterized membrane protein